MRTGWRLQINGGYRNDIPSEGLVVMLCFRPSLHLELCKVDLLLERKVVPCL